MKKGRIFFCLMFIAFYSFFLIFCIPSYAQLLEIDLVKALETDEGLFLSEIASDVEYIKLETNQNCFMGNTNVVYINGDNLIVYYRAVYQFNVNGDFMKVIARKGKGPGEFIEFGGIEFSPDQNHIFLYNRAGGSILKFDLDAGYEGNIKDIHGMKAKRLSNDTYCSFFPTRFLGMSDFHTLLIHNQKGEVVEKLLKQDSYSNSDLSKMSGMNHHMYRYQDSMTIWDGFNDTIIRISADLNITPRFVLNLGKLKIPKYLKGGMGSPGYKKELKRLCFIFEVMESEDYLFIDCHDREVFKHIIYNKRTSDAFWLPNITQIQNDIDGGIRFWPQGITDDGRLYYIISMVRLKNHFKKSPPPSILNKEKYQKLKEMVDNSDEGDNPIIMLVTLKRGDKQC